LIWFDNSIVGESASVECLRRLAARTSLDSFLDLVQKSELVSDDQMRLLVAELQGRGARLERSADLAVELVKRGLLTEWQAENLFQGKHRGFRLGSYRILRPIRRGRTGLVYLGEHEIIHRRCAIKVLRREYQNDPEMLKRFLLEARAIAALDHPHIIRAYEFDKDVRNGIYYLVTEFVDGQDLGWMVRQQGPLDYRKAADFVAQAAEGLAYAHAAGVVHRDICPASLLVDDSGVLKILNFGPGRFTFEGEQPAVESADYVAPEQLADSSVVDGRTDIYSLGHTFYFLLTGHRPFPKHTLMELLMAHRFEEPKPISASRPDVPPQFVNIIKRMTAKTPTQRYQTAGDVIHELKSWLDESAGDRD
jgi:eukaryotic-like serine/threonine-protein kinase